MKLNKNMIAATAVLAAMSGYSAFATTATSTAMTNVVATTSSAGNDLSVTELTTDQDVQAFTAEEVATALDTAGHDMIAAATDGGGGGGSVQGESLVQQAREKDPRVGIIPFLHRQQIVVFKTVEKGATGVASDIHFAARDTYNGIRAGLHAVSRTDKATPGRWLHRFALGVGVTLGINKNPNVAPAPAPDKK